MEGWDGNSIKKIISYPSIEVLLLDIGYLPNPPKIGRKNLLSIDKDGIIQWVADLPKEEEGMYAAYSWIEPIDEKRFKAWCGSSYCEIEMKRGKILLERFVNPNFAPSRYNSQIFSWRGMTSTYNYIISCNSWII